MQVVPSAFIWLLTSEPKRKEARETEKTLTTANVVIFAAKMQTTVPAQKFPATASISTHTKAFVLWTRWARFQVTVRILSLSVNTTVGVRIPQTKFSRS